jgi:DNA-binding MarR family transcriptional regulator
VPFGHWTFLRILWQRDGLTQRELSAEAGVTEPSTFAAIRAMEKQGYVARRQVAANRKNVYVHLTAKGRALETKLVPLAEVVNNQAVKGVTSADVRAARRAARRDREPVQGTMKKSAHPRLLAVRRTRALADGSVRLEGIDLGYPPLEVEAGARRASGIRRVRDVASSYVKTLNPTSRPSSPSRCFRRAHRHSCIFVSAKSGIRKPEDLKGKRVAAPEYQMTAPVDPRHPADDLGVTDVQHSRGEEEPGEAEAGFALKICHRPPRQTISRMLADGELDAFVTARALQLLFGAGQGGAPFPTMSAREGLLPPDEDFRSCTR